MVERGPRSWNDRSAAGDALSEPCIAWWSKSTDLQVASVRLRAALLMRSLSQRGVATAWFDANDVARYRCVVVSKRYDEDTVTQLRRFAQHGGRLVLDLCDNHFVPASERPQHLRHVENLRALAALADVIVTSAAPLARIVARECPAASRVVVIGDLPDDLSIVETPRWRRMWRGWQARRALACLERIAPPGVTRLVWFGSSEGRLRQSGMVDLARIAPMLAALHRRHPLHLTVISNSAQRYRSLVEAAALPSRYIEWHAATFDSVLRRQHIALIPASPNEFTDCKSDNRVVTALRAGLAVVADPVPSYAAYDDVIALGDMAEGLRRYASDPARRVADASRGQAKALQTDHAERVLARWLDVCGSLTSNGSDEGRGADTVCYPAAASGSVVGAQPRDSVLKTLLD